MKTRRILALVLSLLFLLAAVTACGGATKPTPAETGTTNTTESTTASPENQFKDPMELSIAIWDIEANLADSQNDALFQSLIKRFNITIKPVNITWDDYVDKVNVWASSGQLPDLFSVDKATSPTYKNWAQQGVIKALPDDLSKFPNVVKALSVSDVQMLKIDGKFYCIPRSTYEAPTDWCMDQTMIYRWDWAQQLGITKEPETWSEVEAMLTAFVNSDPEKKGKPVGVVPKQPAYLGVLQSVWNPVGNWVKEDGKWTPAFLSKQTLPAIKEIKKWYDKGLIDKDYVLLKGTEAEDKFLSGRAGAFLGGATPSDLVLFEDKWNKNYTDKSILDVCKVWKVPASPDGKRYSATSLTFWSEAYISAKVSDEKAQRILALADYMLSDEGMHYSSGILNVDYTLDANGKAIPTDPNADMAKKYPTSQADGGIPKLFNWVQNLSVTFNLPEYNAKLITFAKSNYDWYKANTEMKPIDFAIDYLQTPGMEKLVTNYPDDTTRLIMSKGDIDAEYQAIIKGYMGKGLDVVISEVNAEAAKLGK